MECKPITLLLSAPGWMDQPYPYLDYCPTVHTSTGDTLETSHALD